MVGNHISLDDFVKKEYFKENNVAQIFLGSPRTFNVTNKFDVYKIYKPDHKCKLIVHSPYVFKIPIKPKLLKLAISTIKKSLEILDKFEKKGIETFYLIHGNPSGDMNYLDNSIKMINKIKKNFKTQFLIENESCNSVGIKNYLNFYLEIYDKYNIKLCLDTAHFWSSGIAIRNKNNVKNIFKLFKGKCGLIHLNGNKHSIGTGKDVHAIVKSYEDDIWYNDDSGLLYLLKKFKQPIILERLKFTKKDQQKEKEDIQKIMIELKQSKEN